MTAICAGMSGHVYTPYTFRLQGVIDSQADSALSGLDDLIQVKGYDWLEDYMANVERIAKAGRAGASANLAQILKTPSKTPRTAKKTRTAIAKEKQREARVRLANLDLMEVEEENDYSMERSKPKSLLFAIDSPSTSSSQKKTPQSQIPIIADENPFLVEPIIALPSVGAYAQQQESPLASSIREDEVVSTPATSTHAISDQEAKQRSETPSSPISSTQNASLVLGEPCVIPQQTSSPITPLVDQTDREISAMESTMRHIQIESPAKSMEIEHPAVEDANMLSPVANSEGASMEVERSSENIVSQKLAMAVDSDESRSSTQSRQTEFIVPLRDAETPPRKSADASDRLGEVGIVKAIFSPSSVAFAALPSRDPLRGKSLGGQKRLTTVGKSPSDKQAEAVKHVQSIRGEVASLPMPSTQAPISAALATPAPVSLRPLAISAADSQKKPAPAQNSQSGPGVRSSWLRQAMANAGGEQGMRKSMAGNALRKKSEFGHDPEEEDEEEENKDEQAEGPDRKGLPSHSGRQIPDNQPGSKHSNHALTTALGQSTAENIPQSKLARMIADLEEKKAAASLAVSTSRTTLGSVPQATNGLTSNMLGWNPLRSTLGGFFLRDEAMTPKDELGPITLTRNDVGSMTTAREKVGNVSDDDISPEADEQEFDQPDDRTNDMKPVTTPAALVNTASPAATSRANQIIVQAVEQSSPESSSEVKTVLDEVIVDAEINPLVSARMYPSVPSDLAAILDASPPQLPILKDILPYSTPRKSKHSMLAAESTTPMISPPTAQMPGSYVLQAHRSPSKLSQITSNHQSKTSPTREFLPMELKNKPLDALPTESITLDKRTSTPPTTPEYKKVEQPKARATTTPVQPAPATQHRMPPLKPGSAQPGPSSGLSVSTAVRVDDDDNSDESDAAETEESEEEEAEEAEEDREDLAAAVAILAKGLRLSDACDEDIDSRATSPELKQQGFSKYKPQGRFTKQETTSLTKSTAQKSMMLSSSIARKVDGQRPVIGQIDSIMKAQQAREKEAALAAGRAAKQEARDQRKRDEARERAAREKAEQEAERKEKMIRQERLKKLKEEQDRKRREGYEKGLAVKEAAEKEKAILMASQKKAKTERVQTQKETKRPPPSAVRAKELDNNRPAPTDLGKSTTTVPRPHPIMKTIIPNMTVSSTANLPANATLASRPLGAPSKPSLANAAPMRPAKASIQAGLQRPLHHPVRGSTIIPDRKTVTPAIAGGVFSAAVSSQNVKATDVGGEQDLRAEDIELPDIDSDYGIDSEEDEVDIADWAASPALRRAIETQNAVDPARLFGPMPEFKMDDVFMGARIAKRPRSSSANWTGADRLTEQEKLEYAKRMNYRDDTAVGW